MNSKHSTQVILQSKQAPDLTQIEALLAILAIMAPLATARFSFNMVVHAQGNTDGCWTEWNVWDDLSPLVRSDGLWECVKDHNPLIRSATSDSSVWNVGTPSNARISWQDAAAGSLKCVKYTRGDTTACMKYHTSVKGDDSYWLAGDDSGAWPCSQWNNQGYDFCK